MIAKLILGVAASVASGSLVSLPEEPSGFDGQHPPVRLEGTHQFDCGNIRAALKYRQERLPPESVASLEESLRVTLLELSVLDRDVSASDFEAARDLLRTFAWIHRVDATCYAGEVTIDINGMPLRPFIASLSNRVEGETPELRTRTIRLSESGIVYVS